MEQADFCTAISVGFALFQARVASWQPSPGFFMGWGSSQALCAASSLCPVMSWQARDCSAIVLPMLCPPRCHSGSWGQDKPLTVLCSLSFCTLEPKSSPVLSFQLLWKGWNPASLHSLMQCDGLRALAGDCASPRLRKSVFSLDCRAVFSSVRPHTSTGRGSEGWQCPRCLQ